MADLANLGLESFGVEMTERAEALSSFASRFHEWAPDDRRWGYIMSLWSLLDTATSEPRDGEIDRPARIARAVLNLIDSTDDLISCADETRASSVGLILHSTKIVESETFAILTEAGARQVAFEARR